MGNQNIEPKFLMEVFNCPHCKSKTKQQWRIAYGEVETDGAYISEAIQFYRSRMQQYNRAAMQEEK
ncbi:hypothetical protein ACT7CY_03150 [Bacillus pacificus]